MTDRRYEEDGFTLMELVISVAIMGVVFGAVSAAFAIGIAATGDSNDRLLESNAANALSSYFSQDVQSATGLSTSRQCSDVTGVVIISVTRADAKVDYVFLSADGSVARRVCGSTPRTIATEVAQPIATCFPNADCTGSAGATLRVALEGQPVAVTATRRLP